MGNWRLLVFLSTWFRCGCMTFCSNQHLLSRNRSSVVSTCFFAPLVLGFAPLREPNRRKTFHAKALRAIERRKESESFVLSQCSTNRSLSDRIPNVRAL